VLLSNPIHSAFTTCETPQSATPGGSWTENFNSAVSGELFVSGVDQGPIFGTAAVTVNLVVASDSGGVETLNTQMTGLNIQFSNGALGRIDPTTPSTGQTTITNLGNGNFQISSFFDIFTDLSLDGGTTWITGNGPGPGGSTVMTLQAATPEPATLALFGTGLLILGVRNRRAKIAPGQHTQAR
jgi:hypothetical protein